MTIKRVDIRVPQYVQVYTDVGDYFQSENESEISGATVYLLDKVSMFPHKERDIIGQLNIEIRDYECIKDVGKMYSFLDTYQSPIDSQSIIYTPLYWDDNPSTIFDLMEQHSSLELSSAVQSVRAYQGIPGEKILDSTLIDGIEIGCFPTLSVTSTSGLKKFVFSPQLGVGKEEKTLLHKARVLLSCVRYGENFAGISKIYKPDRLIEVLSGRGFLSEHSESLKQYESARNHGLIKILPSSSDRWEVHFIDNEENRKAVEMALQMIGIGEATKIDDSQEVAKKILLPSPLNHPTQTRMHVLGEEPPERSQSSMERINDLLRGIDI